MPHDPRAKGSRATGMLTMQEEQWATERSAVAAAIDSSGPRLDAVCCEKSHHTLEEAAESHHSNVPMEKTPTDLQFSCPLGSKVDGTLRVRCFKEPPWQGRGPQRGMGVPTGALFRLYRLLGWLTFEGEAVCCTPPH
ncbi:hypothetical protein MHYP_G00039440 [Metynnis hypsauchen]